MPARIYKDRLLDKPIMTRLHRDEKIWIESLAEATGKKPATIVRECIVTMRKNSELKSAS